jgi:hypothetical protein
MEIKYYSLSSIENSRIINIIRIVFGFICIAVAAFWISFNVRLLKIDGTLWITIIFLSAFGFYQVWSGLGRAGKFIEIGPDFIRLKKNPILSPLKMMASMIEKIDIFPLNLVFFLKSGKKILLRFGTTFQETNELVKDEILRFAEINQISINFVEEKI